MKWWGWGDPDRRLDLPRAAVDALREELGVQADDAVQHVPLDQVSLPEPRAIPESVRSAAGEVLDAPRGSPAPGGRPELSGPGQAADGAPRACARRGSPSAGRLRRRGGACRVRGRRCGGRPLRRRDERGGRPRRRRRWPCGRRLPRFGASALVELDPRSLTATLGPGSRGPTPSACWSSGEPRSATSRSRSSRRPSAASQRRARRARPRADMAASTTWSPGSSSPLPRAASAPAGFRTPPPGRRCASSSSARRERSG